MGTKQPRPLLKENAGYPLAPTSTRNMERLDALKLRAPCVGEQERKRIAQNYGYTSDGEGDVEAAMEDFGYEKPGDILSPPRFWEQVVPIIFEGLDEGDVREGEIDFAVVRRELTNFTMAGNEQMSELMDGLNRMVNSNG